MPALSMFESVPDPVLKLQLITNMDHALLLQKDTTVVY